MNTHGNIMVQRRAAADRPPASPEGARLLRARARSSTSPAWSASSAACIDQRGHARARLPLRGGRRPGRLRRAPARLHGRPVDRLHGAGRAPGRHPGPLRLLPGASPPAARRCRPPWWRSSARASARTSATATASPSAPRPAPPYRRSSEAPVDPVSGTLSVGVPGPRHRRPHRRRAGRRTCPSGSRARSPYAGRRSSPATGTSPRPPRPPSRTGSCAPATSASWTPRAGCTSSTARRT